MTLKEYQDQSKRTCPDLGSDKLNLAHMILGLSSELSELYDAVDNKDIINQAEELSDLVWYLSNYCTFREYNLEQLYRDCDSINGSLQYNISKLSDIVKKYIAYNKIINIEEERGILGTLIELITELFDTIKVSFTKSLQNNLDKLKIRFPEKFTEENALNRNLELERKELEK